MAGSGGVTVHSETNTEVAMADSTFTFRVDAELKQRFDQAAEAQGRTSAQLLRALMGDAAHRWGNDPERDDWFRQEVAHAIAEADDPRIERVDHGKAISIWHRQRATFERPVDGSTV
jgi:predicted transcriptional regulator